MTKVLGFRRREQSWIGIANLSSSDNLVTTRHVRVYCSFALPFEVRLLGWEEPFQKKSLLRNPAHLLSERGSVWHVMIIDRISPGHRLKDKGVQSDMQKEKQAKRSLVKFLHKSVDWLAGREKPWKFHFEYLEFVPNWTPVSRSGHLPLHSRQHGMLSSRSRLNVEFAPT